MRYFSVEEAEALLPKLTVIMGRVKKLKEDAQIKINTYRELEKKPKSNSVDLALYRSQAEFIMSQINELLDQVLKLGCIPKGVDPYLVDFPHMLNGREVNLCWVLGESKISHYHGLEEGYLGRKPLPAIESPKPTQ